MLDSDIEEDPWYLNSGASDLEEDHWDVVAADSDFDDEAYYLGPTVYTDHELLRIPAKIWPALQHRLEKQRHFVVAWLQAACLSCPERTLLQLVQSEPALFPTFLRMKEASFSIEDHLVLRNNDEVFIRDDWQAEDKAREASRVTELDAFRACRFQQGFASEGMLCNEPPIPLRVLDFLEAQDLVNLSLVSKSMHQAAHQLFHREEAVAAQLHPSEKLSDPGFKAKALQGIRLGSLMQGTPEAIPITGRGIQFLRSYATPDADPVRVTWVLDDLERPHDALTWASQLLQVDNAASIETTDFMVDTIVTHAAALRELRVQLAEMDVPRIPGRILDTVMEIEALVAAADWKGNHILLRIDHTYDDAI